MRKFSFIFFIVCAGDLYTQETPSADIYVHAEVQYNFTLHFSKQSSIEQVSKGKVGYFRVQKKEGFVDSVEYKNPQGQNASFLFNPQYQISFSKAVLKYALGKGTPKKRLVQMTFFDFMGVPEGKIEYQWDNKKIEGRDGNIRSCILYRYSSSVPKGFLPIERRYFIFGGGALGDDIGQVQRYNMSTQQLMETSYYSGGKLVKKEIYDLYHQLFAVQNFEYSFGKLESQKTLTGSGVKIESSE